MSLARIFLIVVLIFWLLMLGLVLKEWILIWVVLLLVSLLVITPEKSLIQWLKTFKKKNYDASLSALTKFASILLWIWSLLVATWLLWVQISAKTIMIVAGGVWVWVLLIPSCTRKNFMNYITYSLALWGLILATFSVLQSWIQEYERIWLLVTWLWVWVIPQTLSKITNRQPHEYHQSLTDIALIIVPFIVSSYAVAMLITKTFDGTMRLWSTIFIGVYPIVAVMRYRFPKIYKSRWYDKILRWAQLVATGSFGCLSIIVTWQFIMGRHIALYIKQTTWIWPILIGAVILLVACVYPLIGWRWHVKLASKKDRLIYVGKRMLVIGVLIAVIGLLYEVRQLAYKKVEAIRCKANRIFWQKASKTPMRITDLFCYQ